MAKLKVEPTRTEVPELVIELRDAKVTVSKGADAATLMLVIEAIGALGGGER